MPNETSRRYLFVAIDRATKWVFLHTYANMTGRFTPRDSKPTGKHAFDVACAGVAVEHRLAPPRHSQTNGMVERFNGRISELVKQTYFANAAELKTTLQHYLKLYNHHIPQRAIGTKHLLNRLSIGRD